MSYDLAGVSSCQGNMEQLRSDQNPVTFTTLCGTFMKLRNGQHPYSMGRVFGSFSIQHFALPSNIWDDRKVTMYATEVSHSPAFPFIALCVRSRMLLLCVVGVSVGFRLTCSALHVYRNWRSAIWDQTVKSEPGDKFERTLNKWNNSTCHLLRSSSLINAHTHPTNNSHYVLIIMRVVLCTSCVFFTIFVI